MINFELVIIYLVIIPIVINVTYYGSSFINKNLITNSILLPEHYGLKISKDPEEEFDNFLKNRKIKQRGTHGIN